VVAVLLVVVAAAVLLVVAAVLVAAVQAAVVLVAAPAQEVEQEPGRAVAMALVRVQEQALARAPPRPSVLDLGLPLARARLGVLGLAQALLRPSAQGPTHPSVQALAALSGMEPAMAPLMELGTKA
jgi:hypothetical protein